jgi:MFS family permease
VTDPTPRRVLVATAAVTTVCVFPAFLTGAVAVQLRQELDFSESGTGLGIAAFFVAAALSSMAFGRVTERIGPSAALRAAALVTAVGQLAIAGFARSLAVLLVLLTVTGTANALAQPAANLLIARHVPAGRQGVAFAVKQSAIPVSTLLAGLAVPTLALTVGWPWAFTAAGVLAVGAVWLVPAADGGRLARGTPRPARTPADADRRTMALLAIGISLGAASAGSLGAFLVSSAVESGISEGRAGLLLSVGSAVGVAMRLVAGVRADVRGGNHLRVVAFMLLGGTVAYALLATGSSWVHLAATPLAFGAGWAWPGLFNLAVVRANPTAPGAATGVTQTGTYVGAVTGPLLFGVVAEQLGYAEAWLLAAALASAAALLMWLGRQSLRRSRADGGSLGSVAGVRPVAT